MKKLFFITLLVIASAQLFAQAEKKPIEASIVGFFNGLSLVNADTLKYYTTTDFLLLESGEIWNLDTLVNKVMPMKNLNISRVNAFEFITIEQQGKMAWVGYHNAATYRMGDKERVAKWLETAVLVKEQGRWKIRMLHSTKLE